MTIVIHHTSYSERMSRVRRVFMGTPKNADVYADRRQICAFRFLLMLLQVTPIRCQRRLLASTMMLLREECVFNAFSVVVHLNVRWGWTYL